MNIASQVEKIVLFQNNGQDRDYQIMTMVVLLLSAGVW